MNSLNNYFKKGDFIGQKYEVFGVLGEGGFGIVYLVYSHETKSAYALKTFRDEYLEDVSTRGRFKKEAQVWIDLERHPYLVRAYFVDEISGRLYIAMEHIAPDETGLNTLEGYLRRSPPDLAQSLRWAIQFCYGMEYAYSRGIKAHRDIKPANILIGQDKAVKISDFGLAGVISTSKPLSGIKINPQHNISGAVYQTMEGSAFGTPLYMSPEQFENAAGCDERSDIYSFGIVLYQMVSGGSLPFLASLPKNDSYEESRRFWIEMYKLHSKASIPKLNSLLFPMIQRCLEKEPKRRYSSFKDLRTDLEPILKRQSGEAIKMPPMEELAAWELFNKGISLLLLDKDEEARGYLDKSKAINPIDVTVWNIKGLRLEENGKYQEAIACYDEALKINPRYEMTWSCKGDALYKLGKYQEAIACYSKAIEIRPIFSLGWYQKGFALTIIGKYNEAIACYDKAIAINPLYAEAWTNKGFSLDELGKYNEAITCCNKALEINPMYDLAWYKKGVILEELGKYQEAIFCYNQTLEINLGFEAAWIGKGNVLEELGKHEEAIVCFSQAIEITPLNKLAWYNKGTVLKELEKHQDAITCYDKAIKIDPLYAEAWTNKGNALDSLGKHQEAIACYDRALEINPRDAGAWFNKAIVEEEIGRGQDAAFSYKRFIELASAQYKEQIEYARKRLKEIEGR